MKTYIKPNIVSEVHSKRTDVIFHPIPIQEKVSSKDYQRCIEILKSRYVGKMKLYDRVLLYCKEFSLPKPEPYQCADFLLNRYHSGECRVLKPGSHKRIVQKQKGLDFYQSKEWIEIRKTVLLIYGKVCMRCSSKSVIQIDHIKPRSKFPHLSLDIQNLQVLCEKCNSKKSNKHFRDYRSVLQKAKLQLYLKEGKVYG